MSLPVTTNTKWKCLPEIHATRLSVSGSLRPKLGLLILSIVLLVSLCFILVPVLSKLQLTSSTRTYPVHPLPLSRLFSRVSDNSNQPVILSPHVLQSSLSLVSDSPSVLCPPQTRLKNNNINVSAVVIMDRKSHRPSNNCLDKTVSVVQTELTADMLSHHVRKNLHDTNLIDINELKSVKKAVITVSSDVKLQVPGELVNDKLVLNGNFKVIPHRDYVLVLVDLLPDNLELYLLQPHFPEKLPSLTYNMLDMKEYSHSKVQIVLPSHSIRSSLSLSPHLVAEGHTLQGVPVYHQASLQFLPQQVTHKIGESTTSSVEKLGFDENFVFILKHLDIVIQMGKISKS